MYYIHYSNLATVFDHYTKNEHLDIYTIFRQHLKHIDKHSWDGIKGIGI